MRTQITALAVSESLGGRLVLDSVTCSLTAGERTGIVGENGSGKTTLLRLLAGREKPDQGEVVVHADGGVGYLPQDARIPPGTTVQGVVDRALSESRTVERRLRRLEAAMADGDASCMAEYGESLTVFELRGGYDADARVERALHGLGLGLLDRDRPAHSLSGGEQVRLRLAAVLAASPEVLLLDEPTNHLDEDALRWLEEHLRTRRGTTVTVSHDRVFLERVATSLLEVDADRRSVIRYGDGYAGYLAEKAAARRRWAQEHAQWPSDVERLRDAAATTARRVAPGRPMTDGNKTAYDRAAGRVQKSVAGRVRQAEERLRRLLADPVPPPPQPLRFAPVLRAGHAQGVVLDAADCRPLTPARRLRAHPRRHPHAPSDPTPGAPMPGPAALIQRTPLPDPASGPYGITAGPDGMLWCTLIHTGEIARLAPGGPPRRYGLGAASCGPSLIAPGPDGALWFTRTQDHSIGRITVDGQTSSFPVPTPGSGPYGITVGPAGDDALWFAQMHTDRIGRIDLDGHVTEYRLPLSGSFPSAITAGPDGALWCTLNQAHAVCRIDLDGDVTVRPLPTAKAAPVGITRGVDDALWLVEIGAGQIGRIDPAGRIQEYPLPDRDCRPHAIVADPARGVCWFTEWGTGRLGSITPDGHIEEYDLPSRSCEPHGLAVGPDSALYVALEIGEIARVEP